MFLPDDVIFIISELNNKGYEAYAVGGCVRDSLLGFEPTDFDITTSAKPTEMKELFSRTIDTGIEHGTITVLIDRNPYEITTYRIDGKYLDNRHPSGVTFTDNLELDLKRRDFTVNAMAYHPKTGIYDPFNGQLDIANRLIRGVGNPAERYDEDGLRMLRAIRFAARLGFDIEKQTLEAIYEKAHIIKNISYERIRDELLKIITSPYPALIQTLTETLLCGYFSSPLQEYLNKYSQLIIPYLSRSKKEPVTCLILFLRYADTDFAEYILRLLKFSNKTIKGVVPILPYLNIDLPSDSYGIRRMLSEIDMDRFIQLAEIKEIIDNTDLSGTDLSGTDLSGTDISEAKEKAAAILNNGDCLYLKDLAVKGYHLNAKGYKGEEIGIILANMLDYVHQDPSANNEQLLLSKLSHFSRRG